MWLGYSDGTRCAYVEFKRAPLRDKQQSITITKTFMDEQISGYVMRPEPIRFHYVGLIPLHEAITKAKNIGSDRVAGRECDIFLFSDVPGNPSRQDLVYHLDASTSLPLKVEAFANRERRESANPSWVWEAGTLDLVQGFHVSLNSRYTSYFVKDGAASTKQLVNEYKIDSLTFNKAHAASTFWPSYDKGVSINDLIARTSYYNTPNKKAPVELASSVSATAQPIVADQPRDVTGWIAGGGVTIGGMLLIVGAFLWMRNR